jgi:hypothetical protein
MPVGLTQLTTEGAFDHAVVSGDMILKTDASGPPKIHTQPQRCSGITKENFRVKVIIGGGKNGRYFTVTDPTVAKSQWPRLVVCGVCQRLDPTGAAAVEAAIAPR